MRYVQQSKTRRIQKDQTPTPKPKPGKYTAEDLKNAPKKGVWEKKDGE